MGMQTARLFGMMTVLAVAASSACAHAPVRKGWTSDLAVRPGSTLPQEGASQQQVITLFEVSQQRPVGRQFSVAGVGYVKYNGQILFPLRCRAGILSA